MFGSWKHAANIANMFASPTAGLIKQAVGENTNSDPSPPARARKLSRGRFSSPLVALGVAPGGKNMAGNISLFARFQEPGFLKQRASLLGARSY